MIDLAICRMLFSVVDGVVIWNKRDGKDRQTSAFNSHKAGKPAAVINGPRGYPEIHFAIHGKKSKMRVHNIIWMSAFGAIPSGLVVDHINGRRGDYSLSNLRLATNSQNGINRRKPSKKTPRIGVSWDKRKGRWCASIKKDHKTIKIGHFLDLADAIKARDEKEVELFGEFSPVFGKINKV